MTIVNRQSTATDLPALVSELTHGIEKNDFYDLGFLFISFFSKDATMGIASELQKILTCRNLLGCSSSGIIGTNSEVERRPACSLILMKLDRIEITPFYMNQVTLDTLQSDNDWYEFFDTYPNENPQFFVLPDPFSIDINQFLAGMNKPYPRCAVIGGLASGAAERGDNTLILNTTCYDNGCVGICLRGDIQIDTVVSQGCRPIGQSYIVTKSDGNIVYELGGRPFYNVLEEILKNATDRDRRLAQEAVFVGIAMDEYKHELKLGDFLIRLLLGVDQQSGAGAVADYVKSGQTVQFHVRDAVSATQELSELLNSQQKRHGNDRPEGGLVFSCTGRGVNLFGEGNHDLNVIKNHVGEIPLAGFFCAGEVGPVGGKNFVHGFTSSIALFYPGRKG